MTEPLQFYLLGGLSVQVQTRPITGFQTQKEPLLLAYLAMTQQPLPRETAATFLWPDTPPKQALSNLRTTLTRIRKTAVADYLRADRQTIRLETEGVWVDALAFAEQLELAQADNDDNNAVAQLEKAVALYRGDFLAGIYASDSPELESWQLLTADQLHSQAAQARRELATHYLHTRQYDKGIAHGRVFVTLDPLREEAHRLLMRLLARDGQHLAAQQQYDTCRHLLADELGVDPAPATQQLAYRLRTARQTNQDSLPHIPTSFVGRIDLLAQIDAGLTALQEQHGRVVTIVGLGGVGKTRLALEVARVRHAEYLHGIHFVSLEEIREAHRLPHLIGQSLGLRFDPSQTSPNQQLFAYVQERELLLILDNAETALGDGGTIRFIQQLLTHAPYLSLLVTSREPLRLQSEWVVRVTGLAFPPDTPEVASLLAADPHTAVQSYEALTLFQQRATQQGWQLAAKQYPAVAESCRLVEGLPLGIELFTALLDQYSLPQLNQLVHRRLAQIQVTFHDRPARHHSLHAVFDCSWQILTPEQQQTLARLSLFRGRFTAEAFTAVTQQSIALLHSLVRKSLVQSDGDGHYTLHPLTQQFAAEKWTPEPDILAKHAAYYLGVMAAQTPHLYRAEMRQAVETTAELFDNVRLAWHTAVSQQRLPLLRASLEPLAHLTRLSGVYTEWAEMLQQAHEAYPTELPLQVMRVALYENLGQYDIALTLLSEIAQEQQDEEAIIPAEREERVVWLARAQLLTSRVFHSQGHFASAISPAEQALTLLDTLLPSAEHHDLRAEIYLALGESYVAQGQHELATAVFHHAQQQSKALDHPAYYEAKLWHLRGVQSQYQGDLTASLAYYQRALELRRQYGGRLSTAPTLNSLGLVANDLRQHDLARHYYEEALAINQQTGNKEGESAVLHNLGLLAQHQRQFDMAQDYYQQSLRLAEMLGYERGQAVTGGNLGDVAFFVGDYARAQRQYAHGLALREKLGDERGIIWSLCCNAITANTLGDFAHGEALATRAVALAEKLRDEPYLAFALIYAGDAWWGLGLKERAVAAYERALQIRRQIGLEHLTSVPLTRLGQVALAEEELDTAVFYVEALRPFLDKSPLGNLFISGQTAVLAYTVLSILERKEEAEQVLQAAHRALQTVSNQLSHLGTRQKYAENVVAHRQIRQLAST